MSTVAVEIGRKSPAPRTFDEAETVLSEALPGYEARPQQQDLARAVETAIADEVHLLAEAGTGTGKSLGYLIPAILSGKRVVVSTATKALQEQLGEKDLPFLQEHLGVDFTWAILKGRSNYFCVAAGQETDPAEVPLLEQVLAKVEDPEWDGLPENLGIDVEALAWSKLTSSSDDCPGRKTCPFGDVCYAERAKDRAADADVVVVNHALLMTDLAVRAATDGYVAMLGEYDVVIFDEAHEIEEYASNVFGNRLTEIGLRNLIVEAKQFAERVGATSGSVNDAPALGALATLWETLKEGRIRPETVREHEDAWVGAANAFHDLWEEFARVAPYVGDDKKLKARYARIERRLSTTAARLVDIVTVDWAAMVRWVEVERSKRGREFLVVKTAPIDLAPILRENLFGVVPTILVSATLSVGNEFGYIAGRLGVDTYRSLDVGTPFDYETQARLYVPGRNWPDPGKERTAWESYAIEAMHDMVTQAGGGALLLFTSNAAMRKAHRALESRLPFDCLMQGTKANRKLAEEFTSDPNSVLFATRSFFTGVDFQGDTCRLVIIDKLPFPVPSDPIVEARCENIKARGGNDFQEYTIPVMVLTLKQGVGRLIRHRNDRGVMAILDPRLTTKGYGTKILQALPEATRTEQAEVGSFLEAA
jgi:ATP-dependent DNA helicase DinG